MAQELGISWKSGKSGKSTVYPLTKVKNRYFRVFHDFSDAKYAHSHDSPEIVQNRKITKKRLFHFFVKSDFSLSGTPLWDHFLDPLFHENPPKPHLTTPHFDPDFHSFFTLFSSLFRHFSDSLMKVPIYEATWPRSPKLPDPFLDPIFHQFSLIFHHFFITFQKSPLNTTSRPPRFC